MHSNTMKTGFGIAVAAAALFAATAPVMVAHATAAAVKCSGINSCKGTSECKSAKNDCKGHNSCKGMGWISKSSAEECTKAGGSVEK